MQCPTPALQAKFDDLQNHVRRLCGVPTAELTIRGQREFTLSAEGNHDAAFARFAKDGKAFAKFRFAYDSECDFSCLYFEAR